MSRITIKTIFEKDPDKNLIKSAKEFAKAQGKMAADSKEDKQHWHHIVVRDLIIELALRLERSHYVGE